MMSFSLFEEVYQTYQILIHNLPDLVPVQLCKVVLHPKIVIAKLGHNHKQLGAAIFGTRAIQSVT